MEIPDTGMELTGSDSTPVVDTPSSGTTPEEVKTEDTPVDPTPENPEETPAPEEVLYETPDGRKVSADVLQKEWKDNFLPEFTKKSQELADLKREKDSINPPKDEPKWKNPDYVPENYAEVIEIAKAEAIQDMRNSAVAEQEKVKAIQTAVDGQLNELKTLDPKLDENTLFQHANKYGFRDLKTAYTNMVDMKKVVTDTEQRTVKNLKNREADPIAGDPGGDAPDDSGYDPAKMSQFDSAAEYMESLKGKK